MIIKQRADHCNSKTREIWDCKFIPKKTKTFPKYAKARDNSQQKPVDSGLGIRELPGHALCRPRLGSSRRSLGEPVSDAVDGFHPGGRPGIVRKAFAEVS